MAFLGNYTCNTLRDGMLLGTFDFGPETTDTYRIALYNNSATLNASTPGYTNTGEITAEGYTAGGEIINPIVGFSNGVTFLNFENVSWNGELRARGALIYKDDGADYPAVCVLDFGAEKESFSVFVVQFPPSTSSSALIRLV